MLFRDSNGLSIKGNLTWPAVIRVSSIVIWLGSKRVGVLSLPTCPDLPHSIYFKLYITRWIFFHKIIIVHEVISCVIYFLGWWFKSHASIWCLFVFKMIQLGFDITTHKLVTRLVLGHAAKKPQLSITRTYNDRVLHGLAIILMYTEDEPSHISHLFRR